VNAAFSMDFEESYGTYFGEINDLFLIYINYNIF
jgi:hypothetical protein